MANFIVIIDPDPERRSYFIKTVTPLLPPVKALVTNSLASGDFYSIWSANATAPISYTSDETGAAVVWGEAIDPTSSDRTNAANLKKLWHGSNPEKFPIFDGFYAAVVYHPETGLAVGADLLGIFPIYYYINSEIAIIGSSPELFKHHPKFNPSFNPAGLVGILLTHGLCDGQTLWQEVLRLGAGNLLIWQPGKAPKEVKQYQIYDLEKSDDYSHLTFNEQVDILGQVMERSVSRHTSAGMRHSLMLSGGLDSRLIAGFLHEQKIDTVAFTLGLPTDVEMECARPVARTLGFEHDTATISWEEYPNYADLLVKWEHLSGGFHGVAGIGWGSSDRLQNLAPRVLTGLSIGIILGIKVPFPFSRKTLSFDTFFESTVNPWGLSPKLLERLLKKEVFKTSVSDTLARLQAVYQSYSNVEFRRAWWLEIYRRQRFHIGSTAWRLCFGAWPVLPFLDWQVLKTTASLSVDKLGNRRGEAELLRTRFPQLAELPLDRNSFNIEPLQPPKIRQQLAPIFKLQQKWRRLQQKLGYDRRHYYRIFDINNPGWRKVRQQAEPYRKQVRELFHEDVLNLILPPSNAHLQFKNDTIIESSSIKALIGFLLWSGENL